jgi:hypothetical protein
VESYPYLCDMKWRQKGFQTLCVYLQGYSSTLRIFAGSAVQYKYVPHACSSSVPQEPQTIDKLSFVGNGPSHSTQFVDNAKSASSARHRICRFKVFQGHCHHRATDHAYSGCNRYKICSSDTSYKSYRAASPHQICPICLTNVLQNGIPNKE